MNDPVTRAAITCALPEGGSAYFVQKMGQGLQRASDRSAIPENTKAAVPKHGFH
jgi:hypothetical protein